MSDQVRVQGIATSYCSCKFLIDNDPIFGLTDIAWAEKIETGKGWSLGPHYAPTHRTAGKYTPDNLKTTVYTATARAIFDALATLSGGRGLSRPEIEIVLQYAYTDEPVTTIEFHRARLVSRNGSITESVDPLKKELEWDVMSIEEDKLVMFDASIIQP